jgi:predicted permease
MRWFRREKWDAERARELDAHLEIETAENVTRGMPAEEARLAARRKLGNRTLIREEIYRMNTITLLESIWQDVRYALRQFRRSPAFTAAAVLSLALGIGANTAIFSLLDQVLLRQPPVREPGRLALLNWEGPVYSVNQGADVLSYPMYRELRDRNQVFSGLIAYSGAHSGVGYRDQVERVRSDFVSGNYFEVLGVSAALGRVLTQDDDRTRGAHPVVVLSYDFWTSRFHSDPAALGTKITINAQPFTVVGFARKGFNGMELGSAPMVWFPMAMRYQLTSASWAEMFGLDSDGRWLTVFGRLKPGMSREQAKASLQPLFHSILESEVQRAQARHPMTFTSDDERKAWMNLLPVSQIPSGPRAYYGTALKILMAITGLVLLLACANVANLMLARAMEREHEVASRIALGASPGRLARHSVVESLLLSLAAGVAGLVVAWWTDRVLAGLMSLGDSGEFLSAAPYGRILIFALVVSMCAGLLFGLAPVLGSTRIDLSTALKQQAGTAAGTQARFRRMLAFAQVFLSAVLLMGAGLFLRSLQNLRSADPGFRADHLLAFTVEPSLVGYNGRRAADYFHEVLDRLRAAPAVESAGYNIIRLLDDWWGSPLTVEGYQAVDGKAAWAVNNGVSPAYFAVLGTAVLTGRDFTLADGIGKHKVAVVNETFARKFLAKRSPVGSLLGYGADPGTKMDLEIIGVVRDSKYGELREETMPEVFVHADQMNDIGHANFYVRTRVAPEALVSEVRRTVSAIDPNVPLFAIETMEHETESNLSNTRMVATLAGAFGILATFLAAVGLYALLAFNVLRRAREFGIRLALGARRADILWLVTKEIALIAGLGITMAAPAAWGLGRLAQSELYGISAGDPGIALLAGALLIVVACLAAWLPARRATQVDPVRALR